MDVVYQAKPMNMAWCLQCHRDPTASIRPRDQVTHLFWQPGENDPSTVDAFASLPQAELARRASSVGIQAPSGDSSALAKAYIQKIRETKSTDALKAELGAILKDKYHINPSTDCITCHR